MAGYADDCYMFGHTRETLYEDEEGYDWECMVCGAEGWTDWDEESLDFSAQAM